MSALRKLPEPNRVSSGPKLEITGDTMLIPGFSCLKPAGHEIDWNSSKSYEDILGEESLTIAITDDG